MLLAVGADRMRDKENPEGGGRDLEGILNASSPVRSGRPLSSARKLSCCCPTTTRRSMLNTGAVQHATLGDLRLRSSFLWLMPVPTHAYPEESAGLLWTHSEVCHGQIGTSIAHVTFSHHATLILLSNHAPPQA